MSLSADQVQTLKDNLSIGNVISWDKYAYNTSVSSAEVTEMTPDYVIAGEYKILWKDITWARRK